MRHMESHDHIKEAWPEGKPKTPSPEIVKQPLYNKKDREGPAQRQK